MGMSKAYTIGLTELYDECLRTKKDDNKIGQRPDYEGGWVWRTPEDACRWLHKSEGFILDGEKRDPYTFSVYTLDLPNGWETDVSPEPGPDGVHLLLHDAKIVAKSGFGSDGKRPAPRPPKPAPTRPESLGRKDGPFLMAYFMVVLVILFCLGFHWGWFNP